VGKCTLHGHPQALKSLQDSRRARKIGPPSQEAWREVAATAPIFFIKYTEETQDPINQSVNDDFTVVLSSAKNGSVHPVIDPIKADKILSAPLK
jgi:hypothetical protein